MTILTGGWQTIVTQMAQWTNEAHAAVDKTVRDEAMLFSRYINKAFTKSGYNQKWRRLSPITLALRKAGVGGSGSGGNKPLVRSGALRKSIKVNRQGFGTYRVGVRRTARTGINVAALHDSGPHIIPVTDKMRRYFMTLFWKGILPFPWPSTKTKYIVIPRRSFLSDTFKKFAPGSRQRMAARYKAYVAGSSMPRLKV